MNITIKKLLFSAFAVFLPVSWSIPVNASIFENNSRWSQDSSGRTVINVCIESGSSVDERSSNWYQYGLAHGWLDQNNSWHHLSNPSLDEVISRIRGALRSSWERTGSIAFVGWQNCNDITEQKKNDSIRFWIHPTADNKSSVGRSVRGQEKGTQIKPWGNGGSQTQCIRYNSQRASMEYQFSCAEQYAIHEFGHALGFLHEWQHPLRSDTCQKAEQKISGSLVIPVYSSAPYTVVNLNSYDWDSIMTYDSGCADVTGERFGSTNLSGWDVAGLQEVYPAPAIVNVGGKCLDVTGAKVFDEGAAIGIWTCNQTGAQYWKVVGNSIRNAEGKCLDVKWGEIYTDWQPVWLYSCNGSAAQQWTISGDQIRNVGGKCLDVKWGNISTNGTDVQIYSCNGTNAQRWSIIDKIN